MFSAISRNNYTTASDDTTLSVNNFKAIMGYALAGLNQGLCFLTNSFRFNFTLNKLDNMLFIQKFNFLKNNRSKHLQYNMVKYKF